jgi:hypothetical protein
LLAEGVALRRLFKLDPVTCLNAWRAEKEAEAEAEAEAEEEEEAEEEAEADVLIVCLD